MKISQHDIAFRTEHSYHEKYSRQETLTFATRDRRQVIRRQADGEGNVETTRNVQHIQPDRVEVSEEGKKAAEADKSDALDGELTSRQKLELQIITKALGRIFKGKFRWLDPEELLEKLGEAREEGEKLQEEIQAAKEETTSESRGADYAYSYRYEESYRESEKLTFAAEGMVKTADGQKIDFNLDLNISRSFFRKTSVAIQGGNAKLLDPLVINYDGKAAELSEETFEFDLNADGVRDKIARLKPGSGFLALDKNENEKIDDGGELFGPETGKGFEELAEHDGDRNRFIDENDAVYDKLALLTTNLSGGKKLLSLEEAGIGAIFLGSAETDFSYKRLEDNQLQGQLKRTGVFIGADGEVGSVQKIELATAEAESAPEETG